MNQNISNQTRRSGISINAEVSTTPTIRSSQADFFLCEADYLRLKNGKSKGVSVAMTFFLASLGFFIPFLAKYLSSQFNNEVLVYESWEWLAPILAIITSVVIYIIFIFIPNDYKKVMRAIDEHFKCSPRTHHVEEVEK